MLRSAPSRFDNSDRATEAHTLRTLNTFAIDLMSIPSVEDLYWYVAQNVVGKLNFTDCVIYQADEKQTELTQVSAWGEKNPYGRSIINPLVIKFGTGITGQVAQTRTAIIVDDLLQDQNYISDTQPARSEICVPLIAGGRVMGLIDSEHPAPKAFGQAELEVLSTVAAMTSAKLELLAETQRSTQRYQDMVASHARLTDEISTRKALEAKLFESRKHEAIGRLTGRFAHEFNNLLTVISGNLELLESRGVQPEAVELLSDAKEASDRGAKLIRDMLAFAQKTRLNPRVLDINKLIYDFCDKSRDTYIHHVELSLSDDLWPVTADPGLLENVILNLVMNANDAMPRGGHLRLRSENIWHDHSNTDSTRPDLVPGRYVRLSVTDQGVGIENDRLAQIFDPFYTSKAVGSGTGLGLSIVSGFMRQSGGAVTVATAVGEGTTFQLYFPATDSRANDLLTMIR